jgi:hypothetical protein
VKGLNLAIGLVFGETGRIFTIFAVFLSASTQKIAGESLWMSSG